MRKGFKNMTFVPTWKEWHSRHFEAWLAKETRFAAEGQLELQAVLNHYNVERVLEGMPIISDRMISKFIRAAGIDLGHMPKNRRRSVNGIEWRA
jgi:hypothetical protein